MSNGVRLVRLSSPKSAVRCKLIVLPVVLCVLVGSISACTSHHSARKALTGLTGHPAPLPGGGAPSVLVSGRPVAASVTTHGTPAITPQTDPVWADDQQIGAPYDIAVAGLGAGATVSFPVTEDEAPKTSTEAALYLVSVYEPQLHLWVPLSTTWNAASRSFSAVAPHFSDYRLSKVLKQHLHVGETIISITNPWAYLGYESLKNFAHDAWPEQKKIDCSNADSSLSLHAGLPYTKFCLTKDNPPKLLFENDTLLPVDVQVEGLPLIPDLRDDDSIELIAGQGLAWLRYHGQLVDGHGSAEITLPASAATAPRLTIREYPDVPELVLQAIFAALSVLPVEDAAEEDVARSADGPELAKEATA